MDILDFDIKTSEYAAPSKSAIDTIGIIGIAPEVYYEDIPFIKALSNGVSQTISSFGLIIYSLQMLGSGGASISDLGGPIMIAQLAGQTAEASSLINRTPPLIKRTVRTTLPSDHPPRTLKLTKTLSGRRHRGCWTACLGAFPSASCARFDPVRGSQEAVRGGGCN